MSKSPGASSHDDYAEAAVLGAALVDAGAACEAMERLRPDHFYDDRHRLVFDALIELSNEGITPDLVTVSARMDRSDTVKRVGGHGFISALVDSFPDIANVRHYAEIVRETYTARRLYGLATSIQSKPSAAEMMDTAQGGLDDIARDSVGDSTIHISAPVKNVLKIARDLQDGKVPPPGVVTGLEGVDRHIYSMRPGELVILAARPSVGKTAAAIDIAVKAALAGKSVLFASLEMTADQLTRRVLSNISGVPGEGFHTGYFGDGNFPSEWDLLADAQTQLVGAKLFIDDRSSMTPVQLRAIARKQQRNHGLDLIILDYLQLMDGSGRGRFEVVTDISKGLKAIAKDLAVPTLALSQLKRRKDLDGNTGKKDTSDPTLTDLRESGQIEQDADKVIFLVRDRYASPEIAKMLIAKHRDGSIGKAPLNFDPTTGRFSDGEWSQHL